MWKNFILGILFLYSADFSAQGYPDLLSGKIKELSTAGNKCWTEGGENCIDYFKEAYQLAQKSDKNCVGCIEVDLAKSYSYLEKFDSAQYFLQRAEVSMKKMNYKDTRVIHLDSEIQSNIAMNFYFLGKIDSAIFYLKKNIKIIDKTGNKKSSAFAKINLASIYASVNDHKSAIQTYLKAYKQLETLKMLDDSRMAVLAGNLATSYEEFGNSKSSILWSKRAIDWGKKTKSITGQFYGNYLMGYHLSKTKPDSAFIYIKNALKLAEESGRPAYLAKARSMNGLIMAEMKKYPEAKANLLEAVKLMERNPGDNDYIETVRNLGLVANESGDYALSSKYLKEYILIKDSLNVTKNQKLIHEFQAKYETEKKEKQIAEQKLKIQEQNAKIWFAILGGIVLAAILGGIFLYHKKAEKLKLKQLQQEKENAILSSFVLGEERERNRISHELHDGVAAMIGAAKMSLESIPHLSQEKQMVQLSKVVGILEDSHADIRHIAHNLLPIVLEKEGLIKATKHFANEINETKLVNILVSDHDSNANEQPQQLQLMLFRIIQELVNNIVKHSQAKNAEIIFSKAQNSLQIEITDDGIGYDEAIDQANQGLYSISQRLKSIGGQFKISRKSSGGTQAKVELVV